MAPRARFELATLRLTAECSTVELPGSCATPLFSFYYSHRNHATSTAGELRNATVFILLQPSKSRHFNRWFQLTSNIVICRTSLVKPRNRMTDSQGFSGGVLRKTHDHSAPHRMLFSYAKMKLSAAEIWDSLLVAT